MGDFAPWAGAGAAVLIAAGGGLFRLTYNRFKEDFREIDTKMKELFEIVTETSRRNEERHEENVQRLTRVETLVGNGHGEYRRTPRRRPSK